ncbi:MAG: NCS2 family permease [Candidatus Gastranaerophilales bacterium]|nr:NCS2 family permease [Candidatus Gastranaerophilales bacterium]
MLNKIFKINENYSTAKVELIAGLTTFFTMSYLFVLSPKILESAGMEFSSALTYTILSVFICSMFMAFIANKPYAAAPFLGETAFVAYTVVLEMGFSLNTAFAAIFTSGIILLLMTIFNFRMKIVNLIPETIKLSFCAGLGLFFISIALKDIGIIQYINSPMPVITGKLTGFSPCIAILSFMFLIILIKYKVKAAVIISIIAATIAGIVAGDVKLPESIISMPVFLSDFVFNLDFKSLFNKDFIPVFFVLFLLVNIDTLGAIVALNYGMDTKSDKQSLKKVMIADSLSVITAPLLGTTTPGAYIDSMTGIKAGGKTGLTAFLVGSLFLSGIFFIPIIKIIPPYAYSPVLIYVGILMVSALKNLDFDDITEFSTAIITISIMIFTYNIGIGIMSSFIIYPVLKLCTAQIKKTNIVMWFMFVLALMFFIMYPYK